MSFEFFFKEEKKGRLYGIATSCLKRMTLVWLKIIAPTVFSKKTTLAKIDW